MAILQNNRKKRSLEFCLTCRCPPPFSQQRSQMYRKRQGVIRQYTADGPSINQNENGTQVIEIQYHPRPFEKRLQPVSLFPSLCRQERRR